MIDLLIGLGIGLGLATVYWTLIPSFKQTPNSLPPRYSWATDELVGNRLAMTHERPDHVGAILAEMDAELARRNK